MATTVDDETSELENYKLLAAAREFLERLVPAIRYSELFEGSYAINSRLKNPSRLSDKIVSKRKEGRPDYCLADVTDIIGIRFISLYRHDVSENVRTILELVTGDKAVNPNPLRDLQLIEFKSYTSNSMPDQDLLNLELQSLYNENFAKRLGSVELQLIPGVRYSSVHIVLKALFIHDQREHVIPLEIQFRSVFEDAWSEIDHKLLYELGRFGQQVDEAYVDTLAQHMSVLKRIVDTAAEYADVIRRTLSVSREKPVTIERNLDDSEYIRELAPRAGLSPALTDDLAAILREKSALDEQIIARRPEASALQYVEIANKLRAQMPSIDAALDLVRKSKAVRTIRFSVRMEEALCRLLSGDPQQIHTATETYAALTREYPEFPAVWFRSAQAHQRLSDLGDPREAAAAEDTDASFKHFGEALRQLEVCRKMKSADRILLISPLQEAYISVNAGRLQGFVKWRLSDRRRRASKSVSEKDLLDILLAHNVSRKAYHRELDATNRLKLANNVAFYAAEAHELANELAAEAELPDKAEIQELILLLEQGDGGNILRLDTIVRASLVVGNKTSAVAAARHILDMNAEGAKSAADITTSPYVKEATERAVQNAWRVVRDEIGLEESRRKAENPTVVERSDSPD